MNVINLDRSSNACISFLLISHLPFAVSTFPHYLYEHSASMYEHDLQMHVVDHLNACEAENGSQKGQRRKKKKKEERNV